MEFENKNGVVGKMATSGIHYGNPPDRPLFVPSCCLNCQNYDDGEFGDYGVRLSPPYCILNIWFPTKKGTCKKQKAWGQV